MNMTIRGLWVCVLAMPALACAQGSVTITGIIDGGVTYVSNQHGGKTVLFDSGVFAPNLLSIKGTEDLGGGNRALFELTNQFDLGSGASVPDASHLFGRTALVGLSSARLGALTLGNQYDFMFDTLTKGRYDGAYLFGGIYDFRQGPFAKLGIPGNPTGAFDFDRMAGANSVPNAVKYVSPEIGGLHFGAMYSFGGVPGEFSADSTTSFGLDYSNGPLGLGAAYVNVKYPELDNGHDGIRNFGFGAHYQFPSVLAMLLYTNTMNTASGAKIDVYKASALWTFAPRWSAGLDYAYMSGNTVLDDNHAHQVTGALQYSFSPRTLVYVQVTWQHSGGDGAGSQAWINGLLQTGAVSSTSTQYLARIGLSTRF